MGTLSVVAKDKKGFTKTVVGKDMISLTIPDSVTVIEDGAFSCCDNLENVTMPSSVKSIGESAFDRCESLKSVTMHSGVESVGDCAFYSCKNLNSVTIPDSVTNIGEGAFCNCTRLENIIIPNSVTSIGKDVFSGCNNLKSVTIPDSVTNIGEGAFCNCTRLENVRIPDSVISIGNAAFSGCDIKSVTIPDSVTSIGDEAFCGCESLENATISGGVTNVGKRAFMECKNLKCVAINKGVTSIGEEAFSDCNSLEIITIPDGVKSIGKCAFENCKSLKSVTIPYSVTCIDSHSFDTYKGLERIIGISGSYAEKWAEENYVEFEAQTSNSNKTCSEKQPAQSIETLKDKSLMPNNNCESDSSASIPQQTAYSPFQASMKIGTHHITEGVQRIEVMNMWSVDIPTGYKFSLDSEYTGKSIGGENRPLVIMIDNEYSDFLYPYQSEINFVVFATRQVGFNGQPLNSLNSRGIITQMNESIKRSTKNYKFIVETELISVQYVTVEHRKNESEFNISIFTQDTWFLAQFLFNEPALGKDERVKMVEDWMKTIEPLQKKSSQKTKNSKNNAPDTLEAQEFSTVFPSKNLYWHYDMLQNQKHGLLSGFAEVSINASGTEFICIDFDTVVEDNEYLEMVTSEADAGKNNYKCHEAALEMSRVFRVAPYVFDYQHDREGEIRDKTMRRAYNLSALRSFAWTLGAYKKANNLDVEQISIDVLLRLEAFVKSRNWLNYTDKSYFKGLCAGGDLHMFYLPDKAAKHLVKENVVDKNKVASLDSLRNDLSYLEPIMWQIQEHLYLTRDRSQPLSTPLSDVLYAWCVLALAAKNAFITDDGPMCCEFSQYND